MHETLLTIAPSAAALCAGGAVWLFAETVLGLAPKRERGGDAVDFATEQVRVLETTDPTHRVAGRLIDELIPWVRWFMGVESLAQVARDLSACGLAPPWSAERYVAAAWCRSGAVGLAAGLFVAGVGGGWASPLFAAVAAAVAASVALSVLRKQADDRSRAVGASLAFAADLMTLVLRAGGTAGEAFQAVARECDGSIIGEEFRKIVDDVARGTPRQRALQTFAERFPETAVRDFVFAVIKGEETGTPIGATLTAQAGELRRKQSQACERQAAEAGVKMSFPNMLVMIACMIVIVGPFLLPVIYR